MGVQAAMLKSISVIRAMDLKHELCCLLVFGLVAAVLGLLIRR